MAVSTPVDIIQVPQYAPVSVSSSGDNTIINGVVRRRICVNAFLLASNGVQVQIAFKTSSGGILIPAIEICGANEPTAYPGSYNPAGWCATAIGESLVLNLSGATLVNGSITFCLY